MPGKPRFLQQLWAKVRPYLSIFRKHKKWTEDQEAETMYLRLAR